MAELVKARRWLSVLALVGAVAAAVGVTASAGATAASSNELTVGMAKGDVYTLDPQRWYSAVTWGLSNGLCTSILRYADKSGAAGVTVIPGVAEMPVVSNGGKRYTLKLRSAKFSSGKTITGQDLKYTMERMLAPAVDPGSGQYFYDVVGAQAYAGGKAKTISGITATADSVTFNLTAPDGSFPYKLALPMTCPVPVGTAKKPDGGATLMSKYASGPFVIQSYVPDRSMVWVKNPYYNPALGNRGHVDKITFDIGVDPSQAALKIKAGDIDLYTGIFPAADVIQLTNDATAKSQVHISARPAVMTVFLNNMVAPLNNVDVRRAINYAIDRTQILKAYGGITVGLPTDGILPPTVPAYSAYHVYPNHPNLAKAKALIKASGLKTPLQMDLRARNDTGGFIDVANVIAADLAKIGINVKVVGAPGNVDNAQDSNWKAKTAAGVVEFSMDFPDGESFMNLLLDPRKPKFVGSYARFADKSFFGAYARVEKLTGMARAKAWMNLDRAVMTKDAPWAPLIVPKRFDFVSSRVTGYVYSRALDAFNLNTIGVKG